MEDQTTDIQARIYAFMEARGGYVASASEAELFRLLASYGAARAAAERERCLDAIAGLYHGDTCRAAIRSLDTPAEPYTCPGCGRPTSVIYNRANCPACAGRD